MGQAPRSWATSIITIALAVLVACYCLNIAASYLREALPVLVPLALVILIVIGIWRWYSRPRGW
jgi:hypothetical protein